MLRIQRNINPGHEPLSHDQDAEYQLDEPLSYYPDTEYRTLLFDPVKINTDLFNREMLKSYIKLYYWIHYDDAVSSWSAIFKIESPFPCYCFYVANKALTGWESLAYLASTPDLLFKYAMDDSSYDLFLKETEPDKRLTNLYRLKYYLNRTGISKGIKDPILAVLTTFNLTQKAMDYLEEITRPNQPFQPNKWINMIFSSIR